MRKTILALTIAITCLMMSAVAVNADSLLRWNQSITGGTYIQSPVYCDGYVFVGCGSNLYKFDSETGKQVKVIKLGANVDKAILPPATGDGKLFVACKTDDGKASLAIVDANTMECKIVNITDETGYQSISRVVYNSEDNAVYMGTWGANKTDNTFVMVKDAVDNPEVVVLSESVTGFYWAGAAVDDAYVVYGSNSVSTDPDDEKATPATGDANIYVYVKGETNSESEPLVISEKLEGSGSICSTAVEYNGKFLLVGKAGYLYEISVSKNGDEYSVSHKQVANLGSSSTCTPVIKDDKAYIGTDQGIVVVNLKNYNVEKTIETPAEVKSISKCGDKLYATYNEKPGGLFDVLEEKVCFEPQESMQNYCISSIACNEAGSTLFYTNDSRNLMAVGMINDGDSWITSLINSLKEQLAAKDNTIKSLESKNASLQNEVNTYKAKDRTTKITSISSKSKAITVKWAKTSGASGYRIQYAISGKKAKTVTITSQATASKKLSGLSKGKKYTVKVQPYTTVNGKNVYGKYSATRTIKVK